MHLLLRGSEIETFQAIRRAQKDACGSQYNQLEQQAQTLLRSNHSYSERVWWHHTIHCVSRLLLQIFFILSVWFLFYALWYWSIPRLITALFLIIATGFLLSLSYYESRLKWGIIQTPSASVYLGPDTRYPLCGTLELFTEVPIQAHQQGWVFVNGRIRGWIKNQDIRYTE
jgi:hypothetical protein